jgi:tape measure domain-containing protein
MAEEVAAGYVSLYARMEGSQVASEISSVLEGAASTAAGAFTGFGNIVSGIGKDLTLMGVGADALLTKAGKGIMDTISVGENAAITFNTMGKAMGEAEGFADSFIAKLNDFAVRTPFEFTNILPAVKQLMAMGYTANEILDDNNKGILTSAGNAAAALGLTDQGLSNILLQFGHIKSMGKAMSFQLNAMARNGLPVWDMLADHLKMTKEEVRELVRAGKLDADTTIAALMEGMEKYEGMMEAMSHSLSGIMSNMKDALHKPILEMYNSESYKRFEDSMFNLIEPLTNLMKALTPTLDVIFNQMASGVDVIQEKVRQLTGWLEGQNPDVLARIFRNAVIAINSGPLLMLLGKGSNAIGSVFAGFGASVTREMSVARSGMKLATDGLAGFRESFTLLKEPLKNTKEGLTGFYNGVEMLASSKLSYFSDDLRRVRDNMLGVKSSSTAIVKAVNFTMPERQMSNLARASKYLSTEFGKFGRFAANVGKASLPALATSARTLASVFGAFSTKMLGISTVIAVVSVAVTSLMAVLNGFGVSVADVVAKALVGFETFVASLPEKMASIGNMFQNLLGSGQLEALSVQLTQRLPELLNRAFASVFEGLNNPAIGEAVLRMVDIIAETIAVNGPILLDGLLKAIGMAFQGIAQAIPIVAAHIPEFMAGVGNAIIENAPMLLESFIQALAGLGAAFEVFLGQLSHNLGEASVGKDLTAINTSVEDIKKTVGELDPQPFIDLATAVGQLAAAIGSIVLSVIEGVVSALNSPEAKDVAEGLATAVSSLADGCQKFVDSGITEDFGKFLGQLSGDVGGLAGEALESIGFLIGEIGRKYQNMKLTFENGIDFSKWGLNDQMTYIMNVVDTIVDGYLDMHGHSEQATQEAHEMAWAYLDSLKGISPELDNFIEHLKNMQEVGDGSYQEMKTLGEGMDIMMEKLENGAGSADTLSGALSDVKFDDVTRKASDMAGGVEGAFRRAINSSSGFGGQISSNINSASGSFGRIVSDAGVMAGNLGTEFTKAGDAGNKVPPPIDKAMILAMKHVSKLVSGVKGGRDDIIDYAGAMAVAFDILWSVDLYSAGQAIMNSFLAGLQSMWGAIQAFINMIGPWIHGAKGPLDYDRRLLIPAGRAIMGGLYKGLKTGFTTEVMPLVTTMADTIDQAFDSMTMPTPSMAGVSLGNMAAGDVRGPVVMQPTINVYDVDNPETFARESVTYMNQLIESEGRNG